METQYLANQPQRARCLCRQPRFGGYVDRLVAEITFFMPSKVINALLQLSGNILSQSTKTRRRLATLRTSSSGSTASLMYSLRLKRLRGRAKTEEELTALIASQTMRTPRISIGWLTVSTIAIRNRSLQVLTIYVSCGCASLFVTLSLFSYSNLMSLPSPLWRLDR